MGLFDKLKQTIVENLGGQLTEPSKQSVNQQQVVEKKLTNAEIIEQEVAKLKGKFADTNFYFPQNGRFSISKTDEVKIRQNHDLNETTPIFLIYQKNSFKKGGLFSSDRSFLYSMVFLEKGISFISEQLEGGWLDISDCDDIKLIEWTEIKDVEPVESYYNGINIFKKDSTDIIELNFHHINDETFYGLDKNDNNLLIKLIEQIASKYTDVLASSVDLIHELLEKEDYNECLKIVNQNINKFGEKKLESSLFYFYQGQCYFFLQNYDKAYQSMKYCKEIKTKHEMELDAEEYSFVSAIFEKQGKVYDSIRFLNKAIQKAERNQDKESYSQTLTNLSKDLKDSFLSITPDNRKYIVINKQFKEFPDKNLIGLPRNYFPQIKISGNLSENEVYVLHPLLSDMYLPFENYESLLLLEKFSEFQYIMQCLGAKEINIEYRKGKKAEEFTSTSNDYGGGTSYKSFGINGSISDNSSNERVDINKQKVAMHQIFEAPTLPPYLPENLIWYNNETRWQQLYQQRLNGTILKDSILISNENISKGSSSELQDLHTSLEVAIFSVNANLREEYQTKFKKEEKTEWCINVEFYPINKVSSQNTTTQNQLSSSANENEQKYIEEIKFLFEDDSLIDDDERRMLDRKRLKYGISENRAKELEQQITDTSKLSASEQDYQEEYKENLFENGEINDNIRRVLERLRIKLNISEQRAKEIESLVKFDSSKQFTEQELKYIEELKFCLEDDNEIAPSERRMLNKEREKLGISEERADEIEKEFIKTIKR